MAVPAPTSKDIGDALERRVALALTRGGYRNVRRNVRLVDAFGNPSEVDVVFGPARRPSFVECKAYHGSGTPVGLEEVAKFKEVMSLHGVPLSRGLFITTSTYVPRATTIGVRTLDGAQLAAWERGLRRRGLALAAARGVAGVTVVGAVALGAAAWLAARGGGGGAPAAAATAAATAAAVAAAREDAARGWADGRAAAEAEAAAKRGWGVAALLPWAQPRAPDADAAPVAWAFFMAGAMWGRARAAAEQLRERLRRQ
jgi:hypothetical protein